MSHGGGENEGVREKSASRTEIQKRNHFARDLVKISVTQLCESAGFQSLQLSALERFSDITIRYLQSLAKSAQASANCARRSQANVFDIIQSLEEHQSSQGFASASNIHRCLATSGAIKGIAQYVSDSENSPFAYTIPSFPLARERTATPSFSEANQTPPVHIPPWLPAFPHNLRSESQNVACNGQLPIHNGKEEKQVNPFLVPPLSKAAINSPPEINGNSGAMVYGVPPVDNDAKIVPYEDERRPIVQFKFSGKKTHVLKRKAMKNEEKKVRVMKDSLQNGELA